MLVQIQQTFIIIQLEEQQAIDQADEIAAVEGIDILFLGPGDYSSLSGFPGQMDHPQLMKATEQVAAAAKRAGKVWGRPASSAAEARRFMEMGARYITYGSDFTLLKKSLEQIQAQFGSEGFSFDNQLSDDVVESRLMGPHIAITNGAPAVKSVSP